MHPLPKAAVVAVVVQDDIAAVTGFVPAAAAAAVDKIVLHRIEHGHGRLRS